ncbi:MAG: hypothetical protein EA424_13525 [Planctomycetaceae bacterium]|nr:MAG: hypothetical protein EA424_13525 [Planctomycetaceae bacterium]
MAKTRRIIRKQKLPTRPSFDDQLWPVLLALCVLAGFLMGSVLVRLEVDDPHWQTKAAAWIALIVIGTAGVATALWRLDHRRFRRSMQLAILLGLFLHAVFLVTTLDWWVFSRFQEFAMQRDLAESRQQVTVPDYVEIPRPEQRRPDFEQPVPVPSPQPELHGEPLVRQEVEDPPLVPPDPSSVPESETDPRPSEIRREQIAETTPRHSDHRSQWSRRTSDVRPTLPSSQAIQAPDRPAPSRSVEMQARESTPQRQPTEAQLAARQPVTQPSAATPSPDLQMSRRVDQPSAEAEESATPTFRRQVTQPLATPRTVTDLADQTAVSQATSDQQLQPSTTLARRQATAAPEPASTRAEPVPDTPSDVPPEPRSRQAPAASRPEIAQTPTAIPNQRTRVTPRTETATAASRMTPSEAPSMQVAELPDPASATTEATERSSPTVQPEPRDAPLDRQSPATDAIAAARSVPSPPVDTSAAVASPSASARATPLTEPAELTPQASAPATTPRRPMTVSNLVAGTEVPTSEPPTIAAADSDRAAADPVPSRIESSRQTPLSAAPAAADTAVVAGLPTPESSQQRSAETPAATRLPRAPEAPEIAQATVSAPARRQSTSAQPNAATVQADVPTSLAVNQAPSDQPRPSSATIARQPLDRPQAPRSQQPLPSQIAATTTQIARPSPPRIETTATPSVTPAAEPSSRPARATLTSPLAASPTQVESPAVATTDRGVGEPTAQPARMALSRSMSGTAGVGAGRNLDRARPAEDSPSMTASASARRAEPMQDSPQGPALSPAARTLVRRSLAGDTAPSASLPADAIAATATATAADRPAELAASASAVQRPSDARANEGPTTADRGTTEVDLGVTQIVSEGQIGRASGGGQPQLSFEIDAPQLARSERVGGAPLAALAEPTVVDVPTAPLSPGGGQPPVPQTELPPTAVVRTDPGGGQPVSGGPARANETGPPVEVSMAVRIADASIARAELAEAAPGDPTAGGGQEEEEDEEERRRRLVRAANQTAAASTPTTVDLSALAAVADGESQPETAAAAVSIARANPEQDTEARGGSVAVADPGQATPLPIAQRTIERAAVSEATPEGPPITDTASRSPQRTTSGRPAPTIQAQVPSVPAEASITDLAAEPSEISGPAASSLARAPMDQGPVTGGNPASHAAPSTGEVDRLAATEFTRAEAVDAAPGPPEMGGGTQAPTRAASGPSLDTDLRAQTLQIAGMPESGGLPDSSPMAAQGLQPARLAGGTNAPPTLGPHGATADPAVHDAESIAAVGAAIGSRASSPSSEDGPVIAQATPASLPFQRSGPDRLPHSPAAATSIDLPDPGDDQAVLAANLDHSLHGLAEDLAVSREFVEAGLTVNRHAPPGPGGLGTEPAPDAGLNHRRAATDSVQVQVHAARFVRQQPGGRPDFSTAAIVATEPFQQRMDRSAGEGIYGDRGAPPPMTEEAIELGLAYLSRVQLEDGSWSLQGSGESAALVADTAATGLALLAFQGAGYNHRQHQYADTVHAGIQHLVRNQRPDGDLFLPLDDESNRSVWIYSHSIAALALTEAYGMTQDPALREPAQKAVDFLVESQHPERGGWRYSPQFGSDTSVTGWAMMALKSGELANLDVPNEAYQRIRHWLDKSQASSADPHLYVYNPIAPDTPEQRHGRRPSTTMTSVGLLMRLYLGWQRDHENMIRGAEYLGQNLPQLGSTRNPERDTYYWYYGTQVMFHMGGDYWQAWNGKLHPLLVNHQIRQGPLAGSWDPRRPVPDRWAPHAGRLYVTTMNLLSLEVYYRYLPLYEDTAR